MRRKISLRDFGAGAVLGLLLGTAGLSAASFGYDGWAKFSLDFKGGYITGFMAMANLARNLDPGGYVDTQYPLVTQAKPGEWVSVIDGLYKKPENQGYQVTSIIQYAAHELEKKYGKALPAEERTRRRMEAQLQALKKRREAAALQAGKEAPAPPKHIAQPEKTVKTPALPKEKPARKWCRCDGKNPKEERAKRRAARAEAEKAAGAAAKPATAPEAAKQPAAPARP